MTEHLVPGLGGDGLTGSRVVFSEICNKLIGILYMSYPYLHPLFKDPENRPKCCQQIMVSSLFAQVIDLYNKTQATSFFF